MSVKTRSLEVKVDDVNRAKRSVTSKINSSVVDRYKTVIVPAGGDLRNFQRAPAVLWEHGQCPTRGTLPIAHCSSIKFRRLENDILAVTQFKTDDYSDFIFSNYVDGTLTSWSVDFLPEWSASSRPTPEELRIRPDWSTAEVVYRKWELTGYSAVSYPGNPDALTIAVERGLWVPEQVRSLLPPKRTMCEGSGAGGGFATQCKDHPGDRCLMEDADAGGWWVCAPDGHRFHESPLPQPEAEALKCRIDAECKAPQQPPTTPDPDEHRSLLALLPKGLRSYTSDELTSQIISRALPILMDATERTVKDTVELDRGMV